MNAANSHINTDHHLVPPKWWRIAANSGIVVDGTTDVDSSGSAGGSLWLVTDTLSIDEATVLSANGVYSGTSSLPTAGANQPSGSGGRIALYFDTLSYNGSSNIRNLLNITQAHGYTPGTVYIKQGATESESSTILAIRNDSYLNEIAYNISGELNLTLIAENTSINFDDDSTVAALELNNSELTHSNAANVTVSSLYTNTGSDVAIAPANWHIPYIAPTTATDGVHTQVTLYHTDNLGSPVAATNEEGVVLWRKEFGPYGETITPASTDGSKNHIGYTGHVEENEFGLVYMQARWMDPNVPRFLSTDPVEQLDESNLMSFNRYIYGNDNPYRFVDPDGMKPGDTYYSYGAALRDSASDVQVAGSDGKEWATRLYKNPNDTYSYTDLISNGMISRVGMPSTPDGTTPAGAMHNHTSDSSVLSELGNSADGGSGDLGWADERAFKYGKVEPIYMVDDSSHIQGYLPDSSGMPKGGKKVDFSDYQKIPDNFNFDSFK